MINSGNTDADPALSPHERIIVFTSKRPAGTGLGATNLWYSTRPSATADFAPPKLIPSVNSDQEDGDPVLSADGCELYFASTRVGGKHHLFRAQVTP
jgi:Tol biopolymer transport system component